MPGSSSWMPYAPQGVKGFDDNDYRIHQRLPLSVTILSQMILPTPLNPI